jgi:prepilin-type N-terminal cleavage/methylation domain-containing protein
MQNPSRTGMKKAPETTARARREQAGFTLVEALCAIVILSFGLMAITNLMLVAATSNTVANQSTAATALATQQMEVLKATNFLALPAPLPGAHVGDVTVDTAGYFINPPPEVQGVGQIKVRWRIDGVDAQSYFITVRAEGTGALTGPRSRAEFTVFRSCTDTSIGCPPAS